MTNPATDLIHDSALLRKLSPQVRDCLVGRARYRTLSAGETLCWQGEPAETLKIVVEGWVKLYRVSEDGHEALLSTLGRGESFDEVPAMTGGDSASAAEAVSDCKIMYLDVSATCSCTNARGELSLAIMTAAQRHLDKFTNQIESLKVKTASQRLGEYLLTQVDQCDGSHKFELPFGKVVLAGFLGIKPESLSRAFSRLKPIGVKSAMREVRIDDLHALRNWTDSQRAA